jgi:hypothetical protein
MKKDYAIGKLSWDKYFFNLGMNNEETKSKDRNDIKNPKKDNFLRIKVWYKQKKFKGKAVGIIKK